MNYQPKVSIIIPVYNGSNFLAEAIEAALAQTYKNCEVLVINDGSTDAGESEKIALSYGDKIKYYFKENGGVSSALNFAFTKMTGEWFSWLSHDDLYYPEKIEKQIKFINKLIDENVDISKITVRTATESIDKYRNVIKVPSFKNVPVCEKPIDTIINNVYNYRLSGCSFLLPTSCVADVGGFREDIRTVSDVEYWYRLLFEGYQFYCLKNDILVKNRSHGKQVGKTKVDLFNNEMNELFIEIADKIYQNKSFNNIANFEKYYFGLVKRRCKVAYKYVKNTYLVKNVSKFKYCFIYPIKGFFYSFLGTARNFARTIFRKIKVK